MNTRRSSTAVAKVAPTAAVAPSTAPAVGKGALTPSLPPGLRRVLGSGLTSVAIDAEAGGGVRFYEKPDWDPPALTDEARRTAEEARDLLRANLAPGGDDPEALGLRIGRLLAHRWRGRREETSAAVEEALIIDWIDDLGEYPLWAFDQAAQTWRRKEEWHPTIAGMRALCEEAVADDRISLRMLDRLLMPTALALA